MRFLIRSCHGSRREKNTPQKGRPAAVLLNHIAVEMIDHMIFPVIAQLGKNPFQLHRVGNPQRDAPTGAFLLRGNCHAKGPGKQRRNAFGQRLTAGDHGNFHMGKGVGIQKKAVGFRHGTAVPAHRNAA